MQNAKTRADGQTELKSGARAERLTFSGQACHEVARHLIGWRKSSGTGSQEQNIGNRIEVDFLLSFHCLPWYQLSFAGRPIHRTAGTLFA